MVGHFVRYASPSIFTTSEESPSVYQASGYGDLSASKSIWFVLYLDVPSAFIRDSPTGFGSSLHARTLTMLQSSRGLMVAYVILSVNLIDFATLREW